MVGRLNPESLLTGFLKKEIEHCFQTIDVEVILFAHFSVVMEENYDYYNVCRMPFLEI